ncbi:MAG: hypothetical protein JO224_01610 [Pelomonas sp.]|nr:hypothetical protein [Roseateles sp.]
MAWMERWRACAALFALLAGSAFAGADDGTSGNSIAAWLLDDNGCKVSNPYPKAGEAITWTGACVDGWAQGEGTLQWFGKGQPGTRYTGAMKRGRFDGPGVVRTASGETYEGTFVDGSREGEGVYTWSTGDRYEGHFLKDTLNGHGVLHKADGIDIEGEFTGGSLVHGVMHLPNGDTYEGDFAGGFREGKGVYTQRSGERYEGQFAKSLLNGHGVIYKVDGTVFESDFRDGIPYGRATIKAPNGETREIGGTLASPDADCAKVPQPLLPDFGTFLDVAYKATFVVQAGKVTRVDVSTLKSAGDPETDRRLIQAIEAAVYSYECTRDRTVEQEFQFKLD